MTQMIRRSLRARRPTCFNIGDIVEIKFPRGGTGIGALTFKITEEDETRNSKWIVTPNAVDGDSIENFELQEKEIIRLVERKNRDNVAPTIDGKKKKKRQTKQGQVVTSSDSDTQRKDSTGRQRVATENKNNEVKETGSKPMISERERRRMRREALLEEEQENQSTDHNVSVSKQQKRKAVTTQTGRKTSIVSRKSKKRKNSSRDQNEECVKVKMNTGTLYLYRGVNPRAVFVRRY